MSTPLDELSPTQFENLIFDLMVMRGMANVRWRTPGADGGRDIEGETTVIDFSGHQRAERWYVECKRYASAIGWPLIYEKISHADAASADVLLLCTQSSFSPTAITRAQEWNAAPRQLKVRLWPRHELELRMGEHPDLQLKYGLEKKKDQSGSSITQLSLTVFKTLSAYSAGQDSKDAPEDRMLEAALALSRLVHKKMEDIEVRGQVGSTALRSERREFVDISVTNESQLDRHGVWAYASLLAALSAKRVVVNADDEYTCVVRVEDSSPIAGIVDRYSSSFGSICLWSNFDAVTADASVSLVQRKQ